MTPISTIYVKYEACITKQHVQTADGTVLPVDGVGSIQLAPIGYSHDCYMSPKSFLSLVSVQRIAKLDEYKILFDDFDTFLCNKVHEWKIGLGRVYHRLYHLPCSSLQYGRGSDFKTATVVTATEEEKAVLQHRNLGHCSISLLQTMYPKFFKTLSIDKVVCDACHLAKSRKVVYPSIDNRCLKPFQFLHRDIWGPSPYTDLNGFRWFLVCIDDHSRFGWLYLLK